MPFTVRADQFTTEAEALAYLEGKGCDTLVADVPVAERGLHWHDFDSIVAVVDGTLWIETDDGSSFECGPGAIIEATDRVLHRERTSGGRQIFGFPGGMPDLSRNVNRDPADHPGQP